MKRRLHGNTRRKLREDASCIEGIVKKIMEEFQKHCHLLKENQQILYKIVNRQVASTPVNVQNALQIGEQQSKEFAASLPQGFYSNIEKRVKTMEMMEKAMTVEGNPIHDTEAPLRSTLNL